jgi:hypothetical protein
VAKIEILRPNLFELFIGILQGWKCLLKAVFLKKAVLVKDHIIKDIKNIDSPVLLHQLYAYLQVVKQTDLGLKPNRDRVLKFAGTLTNAEAKRISSKINGAFNQIEGEW